MQRNDMQVPGKLWQQFHHEVVDDGMLQSRPEMEGAFVEEQAMATVRALRERRLILAWALLVCAMVMFIPWLRLVRFGGHWDDWFVTEVSLFCWLMFAVSSLLRLRSLRQRYGTRAVTFWSMLG